MNQPGEVPAAPPLLPPMPAGLPGAGFLLRAAWARLLERWKTLVFLTLLNLVLTAMIFGILVGSLLAIAQRLEPPRGGPDVAGVAVAQAQGTPDEPVESFSTPSAEELPRAPTAAPLEELPALPVPPTDALLTIGPVLQAVGSVHPVLAIGIVVLLVVSLAISAGQIYAAGADAPTGVGAALRWGISRVLPLLGLSVLLFLIIVVPLFLIPVLFLFSPLAVGRVGHSVGLLTGGAAGSPTEAVLASALVFLVLALAYALLFVRLAFTHLLVALREATVFGAFRESWRLTKGRFWAIVWRFLALMLIIVAVTGSLVFLESLLITGFALVGTGGGIAGLAQGATPSYWILLPALLVRFVSRAALSLFAFVYSVVLLRWVQHVAGPARPGS